MAKIDFNDAEQRHAFWHSSAHLMAQAVKRLYPEVQLGTGPAKDKGFFYDFYREKAFSADDLQAIEEEMGKIVKEHLPIERFELSREEAKKLMQEKGENFKLELIDLIPEGETISFYQQGEFVDLCAGPHLENTQQIQAFKLLQTGGAYWHNDATKPMLQRIFGIAYPDKKMLKKHLDELEEARKRDHNKIGRELEYFTTVDYIGQGLPILLPKGYKLFQILQRFVEDEEERRGYQHTRTPLMAKADLYKISGHWYHYRDGMFIIGDEANEDEVLALRPMTCPFQFQAYLTRTRSYRDLPLRYAETSTLFRNESSGEMHGLIRLRQFTISEGHLIVTPEQLEDEFKKSVELAQFMLKTLGLEEDVSYRFSKWDQNDRAKYIGSPEEWERVQQEMFRILTHMGIDFEEADGEAAFYGPKLDIQIKNVFGKEDTLITVQIDFQLAKKFEMEYIDREGNKQNPYIIHRTSIGCYERTIALLLEKYAGALPLWMSPEQARVLPISDKHLEAAQALTDQLKAAGLRTTLDGRNEKVGKKIKDAQNEKVPYMLVMGDQEIADGTVAVRSRKEGQLGTLPLAELITKLQTEDKEKLR